MSLSFRRVFSCLAKSRPQGFLPWKARVSTVYFPSHSSCSFGTQLPDSSSSFTGRYFVTATVRPFSSSPLPQLKIIIHKGDESERLESMSDPQIQTEILTVLAHMYPHLNPVPQPVEIVMERWFRNKLFRGAWANWPPR